MAPSSITLGSALLFTFLSRTAAQKPANPIAVSSTSFLGPLTSEEFGSEFNRDGGAEGQLGDQYFSIFADTVATNHFYIVGNTIGLKTFSPTLFQDFNSTQYPNNPPQFCALNNNGNNRLHLNNMVPIDSTSSAIWYTNTANMASNGAQDGSPVSYGVAIVTPNTTSSTAVPLCTPLFPFWNVDSEPGWGSTAAVQGAGDDPYIYVFGALGDSAPGYQDANVYVGRVLPSQVQSLNDYEYWNGQAFQSERIMDPVQSDGSDPYAVIKNVSVGSIFYSNYYNGYIALSAPLSNTTVAYWSELPQGPWSDPTIVYFNASYSAQTLDHDDVFYLPTAQTIYDTSGKTLIVYLSQYVYNDIRIVIKLFFE